jgi:hypothetical protein
MFIAIALIIIVAGSVLSHLFNPGWLTPRTRMHRELDRTAR